MIAHRTSLLSLSLYGYIVGKYNNETFAKLPGINIPIPTEDLKIQLTFIIILYGLSYLTRWYFDVRPKLIWHDLKAETPKYSQYKEYYNRVTAAVTERIEDKDENVLAISDYRKMHVAADQIIQMLQEVIKTQQNHSKGEYLRQWIMDFLFPIISIIIAIQQLR